MVRVSEWFDQNSVLMFRLDLSIGKKKKRRRLKKERR